MSVASGDGRKADAEVQRRIDKMLKKEAHPLKLHEEILVLLKKRATMEHEYINPNFLGIINAALYDYYKIEDDTVDKWIEDMFGA